MHDRDLMDYEPVMHWHTEKVTEKQAAFLERNGIDPATIPSRGHASALGTKIWGRRNWALSYRTVTARESPARSHSLREEQAYRALGRITVSVRSAGQTGWTLGQVGRVTGAGSANGVG
jgi:hypothetical protein